MSTVMHSSEHTASPSSTSLSECSEVCTYAHWRHHKLCPLFASGSGCANRHCCWCSAGAGAGAAVANSTAAAAAAAVCALLLQGARRACFLGHDTASVSAGFTLYTQPVREPLPGSPKMREQGNLMQHKACFVLCKLCGTDA